MTRADEERVRLAHALDRVSYTLVSVRMNSTMDGAGLLNAAQALSQVSAEVLVIAARVDAYERAEVPRGE